MKPWSKLQKHLYNIIANEINWQIHCTKYPMNSRYGSTVLPRYWITLDSEIIWDYPKQFVLPDGIVKNLSNEHSHGYPYKTDVSAISNLLEEYLATASEQLLDKHFVNDYWGLVNILRAADRRMGKRRLLLLQRKTHNIAARKIINARLSKDIEV